MIARVVVVATEANQLTLGAKRAVVVASVLHAEHAPGHRWRSVPAQVCAHLGPGVRRLLLLVVVVEHEALRFGDHIQVHGGAGRQLVQLLD